MKNFQVTDKDSGKSYWISRSMAVTCVVVGIEREDKRILVERRGPGCPDNIGKLVCPCGYLDYDETLKEAARREVYEETGVIINLWDLSIIGINDLPTENRQNVTVRFMAKIPMIDLKIQLDTNTKDRGGEKDEVSEILLLSPDEVRNSDPNDWAFGHRELILGAIK